MRPASGRSSGTAMPTMGRTSVNRPLDRIPLISIERTRIARLRRPREDEQAGAGHECEIERDLRHPQQQAASTSRAPARASLAAEPQGEATARPPGARRRAFPARSRGHDQPESTRRRAPTARRSPRNASQIAPDTASPWPVSKVESTTARPIVVAATSMPPASATPSAARRAPRRRVGAGRAGREQHREPREQQRSVPSAESRRASGAACTSVDSSAPRRAGTAAGRRWAAVGGLATAAGAPRAVSAPAPGSVRV